jgi:drug/metabolite transporter (DMT)-like permease
MPADAVLFWLLSLALDTTGQLTFKYAATGAAQHSQRGRYWAHMARRPALWLGLSCYVLEFIVWIAFISLVPLSTGVLLGSLNIVMIMVAGRWAFKERITALHCLGMLLVSTGVALVGGSL